VIGQMLQTIFVSLVLLKMKLGQFTELLNLLFRRL
jgi:hypothetical protein